MKASHSELVKRAFSAYFRRPGDLAQPSDSSDVVTVAGKDYVRLLSVKGLLAVYRVDTVGRLKHLKRWPKELDQ